MSPNDITTDDRDNEPSKKMPVLGEGFSPSAYAPPSAPSGEEGLAENNEDIDVDPKKSQGRFWKFGRKKDEEKLKKQRDQGQTQIGGATASKSPMQASSILSGSPKPQFVSHPYASPSSPSRLPQQASPHIPSPASSQIFERNVQDEDPMVVVASPAIPGHVATEDHIPSVLDASTEAITDNHLDPDHVEIVMHAAHQPAAMTVAASEQLASTALEESLTRSEPEDPISAYGNLDTNDVRRLSFISFADVMHADKAADHVSMSDSGTGIFPGSPNVAQHNRSPSPIRSPLSNQAMSGTSPTSDPGSFKGFEGSQGLSASGNSPPGAALTVETMRQALRKTGSGDLSAARVNAVPGDEASAEPSLK